MNGARPRGRGCRRPRALWIAVLVLALLAAHALYWRLVSERLESAFESWAAERRSQGWVLRAGAAERGGWPLAATLSIPDLHVEGGRDDLPDGFAWSGEDVRLSVRLLDPRLLSIATEGMQRIRLSVLPEISYTADRLQADVPLRLGRPGRVADVVANDLRARVSAGADAAGGVTVGLLQAHGELPLVAAQGSPALAFSANAEAIGLPPRQPWALGGRISSLSVGGALSGPLPAVSGLVQRAEAWRDGGGALQIERFALGWGPLGLSGSATLALDARLQPMGTGAARIVGYAETLDALAASGVITRRTATAAKAFAALIARGPEDGGQAEIEVPLTLQDRTLSIRLIPLLRIPELIWPAG